MGLVRLVRELLVLTLEPRRRRTDFLPLELVSVGEGGREEGREEG